MAVQLAGVAEGGDVLHVQAVRRGHARTDHVALVELDLGGAGDVLLGHVHKRAHGLAQRGVPQAVVDQLGELGRHLILVVRGVAVDGDLLEVAVRRIQQRSARGLVHAAALHADQTVLHHVRDAHAVAAGNLIALGQQGDGIHLFAVDGDRHALLKVDGDVFRRIRRILRIHAQTEQVARRLVGRVLQLAALMAQVPDVAIHGVRAVLLDRNRDAAGLGVLDLLLAGLELPLAPRGDDRHLRRERLDAQLEADLIVALAGAAVTDRVAVFLLRDLDEALGDQRAGEGGAQQVLVLIDGAGLQGRPDEVLDEFLAQILDVELLRAGLLRLLVQRLELVALAHVRSAAHDGAAVVFLEPRDDDGRIQSAGIRKQHTIILLIGHDSCPSSDRRRFCASARICCYELVL